MKLKKILGIFSIGCMAAQMITGLTAFASYSKSEELDEDEIFIENVSIEVRPIFHPYDFFDSIPNHLNDDEKSLFDEYARKYSRKYGFPPFYLYLFAYIESTFDHNAYNRGSKAAGILQITPILRREYYRENGNLQVPEDEIDFELASWYINRMQKPPYELNTLYDLYLGYNAGPSNRKYFETHYKNGIDKNGKPYYTNTRILERWQHVFDAYNAAIH
jgi:hypothetical protein